MDRRWDGNITYKSRLTGTGWEGEMQIPFAELGVKETPADGTKWKCNLYSFWRKHEPLLSSWPFVRWREKGEVGTIVFAGNARKATAFSLRASPRSTKRHRSTWT